MSKNIKKQVSGGSGITRGMERQDAEVRGQVILNWEQDSELGTRLWGDGGPGKSTPRCVHVEADGDGWGWGLLRVQQTPLPTFLAVMWVM